MTRTSDVLVAGGGIAGLATIRALHLKGIQASALEQRSEPTDQGLAINLPGNAIAALHALGLQEALEGYGKPVRRREYRTGSGRLLFAVDEQAFWGSTLTPRCMRRGDLTALLAQGLPPDAIQWGTALASIEENPDHVHIDTSQGRALSAGLLVGADGVNSTVRRLRFEGITPSSAHLASASWRFMAPNPGVESWTVWAGAKAMALLIPVSEQEVYGWAAATGEHSQSADPGILGELLRGFPRPVRETVEAAMTGAHRLHYSPLDEVRLSSWSRGRTLLVGDAAHATAPVWAQGAALALEDALTLAKLIGCGSHWREVAADYERLRRTRVEHVQAMTDRMSKAARLPTALRNLLLPFMGPRSYMETYGPLKAPI